MRILLVILNLIILGCGKDEETKPEHSDADINQRYGKLKVIAPGDQIGTLSAETAGIIESDYWVDKEEIVAGTELKLCPGKTPARTRYTFNWKKAGTDGNYYWTGEAVNIGGTFISSCQKEEGEETELNCKYISCDKL